MWLGRSQKDGLPSRSRGVSWLLRLKAINSRIGEGSPVAAPSNLEENGRQENTGLVKLAALSFFCATTAWAVEHAVFTSVFAALGTVAVLGAAAPRPRR